MSEPETGSIVTPDMDVEDVVQRFPAAVRILTRLGVICVQCGAPVWGTLAEAVERAGLDVDRVLEEINSR